MRRAEFLAIPVVAVVLGVLFALMIAADLGPWAWVVVVTALVLLGLGVLAAAARRRRHPPAFDAPATSRARPAGTSDRYRVLVVADETLGAGAFRSEVAPHAGDRPVEAYVVAPALRSRLAHWTGDDSQRDEAESHLAATLGELESEGIRARGEIGSDDPIQAADDALRVFEADEVVFVTGSGPDNWLERDVLELARERYDVPVTHVESGGPPA
jgi:GABA permease